MVDLKVIAHIRTDFPEKFGIPRQSGLAKDLIGRIIFEPEFRSIDSLDGLEDYTHLWLLWEFEDIPTDKFTVKVRPPRLGGNKTRGVFATRSPFRPNPIGLSSVKLESINYDAPDGPIIVVSGIDMRDNTPIYDIKPYLAYVDSHPDAGDGFAGTVKDIRLEVKINDNLLALIPSDKREALVEILAEDPRPHYQSDPNRIYGLAYAGMNVKFRVCDNNLEVIEIEK